MKKLLLPLFLLIFVAAGALAAGDLTGKWSGNFNATSPDGENHEDSAFFDLHQSGDALTGTAGPNEDKQFAIKEGKVDGSTITFTVTADMDDDKVDLHFTLHLDGEHIIGQATGEAGGKKMEAKIDLTRVKS
jgi:hypothetical protein